MRPILTAFLLCATAATGFAQTGSLRGKLIDKSLNEGIIGGGVLIKGTSMGTISDVDGNYTLSKIPVGTYTVVVSYVGLKTKEIEGVQVYDGKAATLNVDLEENRTDLKEVVITAQRQTYTEVSLISEIKLSPSVAVGVSAEQIARTQDGDGAQVLRRLPGISIFDDRFVMVRGLSERYNAVLLNGVFAPSSEVDVKSFSFDLLPSSVIDRMLVLKSGSYDLPGEYAGGIIKIFTRNVPAENFTNVSIATGLRNGTTGQTMSGYRGSSTDWLGFDNSVRPLPASFPADLTVPPNNAPEVLNAAGRTLNSTWLPETFTALPDLKVSLGLGRKFEVGRVTISNLTSVSYNNSRLHMRNVNFNRFLAFVPALGRSEDRFRFIDERSNQTARVGILHNWSARLDGNNRLEFRNLFNQLGNSQTVVRAGRTEGGSDAQDYALYYEQRRIYSGQLAGFHSFGNKTWNLDWTLGYANTNRQEPDFRRFQTRRTDPTDPFKVTIASSRGNLEQSARFYSRLQENIFTGVLNLERKLRLGESEAEENMISLKAGMYFERKNRSFNSRIINLLLSPTASQDPEIRQQLNDPLPSFVFNPQNLQLDRFIYDEGSRPEYSYSANNTLFASYLGANVPFSDKFNLSAGVRLENNVQRLRSGGGNADLPIVSLLPSVNFSYNFNDRMLLRAAYTRSVNRPEFRELAPFLYYDFNNQVTAQGNNLLTTATIDNVDLRWEFYPSPSELVTFGLFYKQFKKPIETLIFGQGNSSPLWVPNNTPIANAYGIELEVRKSLEGLSENPFLRRLSTVLNASYIISLVDLGKDVTAQERFRLMMNQSPYLINAGIFYTDEVRNWQVSLLYNVAGPRLFYVGDLSVNGQPGNYSNAFEMPRHVVDLNLTKGLSKRFELNLGIQDLFNAPFRFIQDSNRDGRITSIDETIIRYQRGQLFTIGLKYNL